jgi:hypothetical protein
MRKVVVGAMVSMDGVMQAPGRPQEDTTGGFAFGGWVAPLGDAVFGAEIAGAPMRSLPPIGPITKAGRMTPSPSNSTALPNMSRPEKAPI